MRSVEKQLEIIKMFLPSREPPDLVQKFEEIRNHLFSLHIPLDSLLETANKIESRLWMFDAFPSLFTKRIIMVAGGYSAGKSQFINSFIKGNLRLPTSLKPTTAIPSFVYDSPRERVVGMGKSGRTAEIPMDIFTDFVHDFLKSFDFNIREELLPYIVIETKLHLSSLSHLCFVDLPGYDPAGATSMMKRDRSISLDMEIDDLIWLIDVSDKGTIPKSDIKMLQKMKYKRLYIVLNKAMLRPLDELRDVQEEVADTLDDENMAYEGISCFDSVERREYCFDPYKKTLWEFLQEKRTGNNPIEQDLSNLLNDIENKVDEMLEKECNEIKLPLITLKNELYDKFLDSENEWIVQVEPILEKVKEREKKLKENFEKVRKSFEIFMKDKLHIKNTSIRKLRKKRRIIDRRKIRERKKRRKDKRKSPK